MCLAAGRCLFHLFVALSHKRELFKATDFLKPYQLKYLEGKAGVAIQDTQRNSYCPWITTHTFPRIKSGVRHVCDDESRNTIRAPWREIKPCRIFYGISLQGMALIKDEQNTLS